MSSQNQKIGGEFGGNTSDMPISRAQSEESEAPPPSTLYDPGVLAISPEYQQKVHQRQEREPFLENVDDEKKNTAFHVTSPTINPRSTKQTRAGEVTLRGPEQAIDEEDNFERELCCQGYLPMFTSLVFFNAFNLITGFICLGIGASQLSVGDKESVGFTSPARFVITCSYLLSIVAIVLGCIFILSGCFGVIVNFAKMRNRGGSVRFLELVYYSLILLLTILCMLMFGMNLYSINSIKNDPVYDTELWKEMVRSDSKHLCKLEERLDCAGLRFGQCLSSNNETLHTFCPGHFCVEFCRIASDDVSTLPICAECTKEPVIRIPFFAACKVVERDRSAVQTCDGPANEELDSAFGKLLGVSVIAVAWICVVWIVFLSIRCCT